MTEMKMARVLVVDDEPSILELLRTALVSLGGFEVETAGSGREALALLGQGPTYYDAVLLDIQMPEMNGVEVCERIRDMAGYADLPVIMLTAMSQMDYVDKAFLAGASDYVTKPFNFEDLRNRLTNALHPKEEAESAIPEEEPAPGPLVARRKEKEAPKRKFDYKVDLTGFRRFLQTERFDNYVRQMASSRAPYTSAFAVKISNGYYLHRALSTEEFEATLRDVAALLSEVTEKNGSLISYRGQGIFLCVEYGSRLSHTEEIERFINTGIALLEDRDAKARPKIVVSAHAELKQHDRASARQLMNDAMSGVERSETDAGAGQGAAVSTRSQPPRDPLRREAISTVRQVTQSRPYRNLLSSMLRGGGN